MSRFKPLRRGWRQFRSFWLASIWPALATMVVSVAGAIAVNALAPRKPDPENPGETILYGWGLLLLVLAIVLAVLALISILSRYTTESRPERIKRLTAALQEAESIIAEINRDMEEGAERLAQLERQTAVHQELADLSIEKAAAIREALKAELGLERRRSLGRDLALVVLGAALTFGVERLM